MKHIQSILEYTKAALLPKELRYKNLLYHSTQLETLDKILKSDILYGTSDYDKGVATSRNKHYAFGIINDEETRGYNGGDIQFILDRDKVNSKFKIDAFDWEDLKYSTKIKTGEYNDYHQSEDKIQTDEIKNLSKYIIGIHIIHDNIMNELMKSDILKQRIKENSWVVFDENWGNITDSFKH